MKKCSNCNKSYCTCSGPTKYITERGPSGKTNQSVVVKKGDTGPAGDSSLPIKNTAFVSKNGSDSTGLVERLDKPFLTINAAINAIAGAYPSRDDKNRVQVVVFDGKYTQNVFLKKYVDIHFFNVDLDGSVTDNQVDMGSSPVDAWTNIITGNLRVYNTQNNANAFILWKTNSKVLMYADSLGCKDFDSVVLLNGKAKIYCNRIFTEDTAAAYNYAIEMGQGFLSPDYANESVLEVIGADIYNASANGSQSTIGFESGADSKNQKLILRNCRVKNSSPASAADANSSCIAFGEVNTSNGKLSLYNTVLYSANGRSIFVALGSSASVSYFFSNVANVATTGTITTVLGSLTVDAAVTAEF